MDLGLLRKSKTPSKGGVLDLGLLKSPDPGSRGGVLESEVSTTRLSLGDHPLALPTSNGPMRVAALIQDGNGETPPAPFIRISRTAVQLYPY